MSRVGLDLAGPAGTGRGPRRGMRRRPSTLLALLAAALLLPAAGFPASVRPASAQEASQEASAQERRLGRVRAAFPGELGERIVGLIVRAGEQGLPAGLLANKALEGAQKGQTADRVLEAVADYAEELREARAAVGREVDGEALKEAADALRRGVPASSIRTLARSAGGNLEILFVVMFDLMDDGVPPQPAEALVEDAVRLGVDGDRLLSLPGSVRQLIRGGLEPGEAADSVRRQIGGGTSWLPGMDLRGALVGGRWKEPPWRPRRPRSAVEGGRP